MGAGLDRLRPRVHAADGKPHPSGAVSKAFRAAVKKTGLPVIHLHDLRHTHALLLWRPGFIPSGL